MTAELDLFLRGVAVGFFAGIVSVYWLRAAFAWLKLLMKWWAGHGVQREG